MKKIIINYTEEHNFRERILFWALEKVISIHARIYRKRKPWGLRTEDLLRFAEGTLGRELGEFLNKQSLQPIDKIERHDAFHILLGFSTKTVDEAAMYYFLIGNGKRSFFTLGTAIFATIMLPEKIKYFIRHYKRGKQALGISKWNFRELLTEDFEDLKSYIFQKPTDNESLITKLNQYEHRNTSLINSTNLQL